MRWITVFKGGGAFFGKALPLIARYTKKISTIALYGILYIPECARRAFGEAVIWGMTRRVLRSKSEKDRVKAWLSLNRVISRYKQRSHLTDNSFKEILANKKHT